MSTQASVKKSISESIAVIGCGNLGAALIKGFRERLAIPGASIFICDHEAGKTAALKQKFGVTVCTEPSEAAKQASIVLIAVKPKAVADLLANIRPALNRQPKPLLISVAAGVTTAELQEAAGKDTRIVRVMPNVASLIGLGAAGIFSSAAADAEAAQKLFEGVGYAFVCANEVELDAVTSLGGSAPAFMFIAIEALADGGVRMGLPREKALRLAAEMMRGAASMVIETGEHPGKLKDTVASPGGTTIAGLQILERNGFRGTLISAVEASAKKAAEGREKTGGKQ